MNGRNVSTRVVAFLLALVMCIGLMPLGALTARAETEDPQLTAALEEAKGYINSITINNTANDPSTVVGNFGTHFTWDNEKREGSKSYLFDWSYYNGVVFEGLEYLYEVTGETVYKDYVVEYMSTMINATGNWATCVNNSSKEAAGYNSTHGADCYKTASLLLDAYAMTGDDRYLYTAKRLYADLDTAANTYLLANAGNNFRHTWASDSNPDLWLDGLYMILPFRAEYAKYTNDQEELALIASRLQWVSDNMYNANKGLFYHAADSATSNSGTYWLRSIGWYAAALVDVMDSMSGQNLQDMKAQLVKLVDGMKACQNASNGMWVNDMAKGQSSSNPYETSGTALTCYAIMKAVNNGWLDESYADMAILAFKGICNEKLDGNNLKDICFKGVPGGSNSTYYNNEGKGLGPFIMFYAEVLEYVNNNTQEPEAPAPSEPAPSEPAVKDQTVTAGSISAGVAGVSGELTGAALSDGDKALLDAKNYAAYVALDVNGTVAAGETAEVTFAIPGGWDAARVVGIHIENGAVAEIPGTVSDGRFTFAVPHFSGVGIALLAAGDNSVSGTGNLVSGMDVLGGTVTTMTSGKYYYVVNSNEGKNTILTNASSNNRLRLSSDAIEVGNVHRWYITKANGNNTYYIQYGGPDGQYLTIGNGTAGLTNTATALTLAYDNGTGRKCWTIRLGDYYLNDFNNEGTSAQGYSGYADARNRGSRWQFYPVDTITGNYIYQLDTDGLDYGAENKYLIVGSGNNVALTANGNNTGIQNVTINNNLIILDTDDYEWYFLNNPTQTGSNDYNTLITQTGNTWLYHTNSNMYVGNNNDSHRGYWRVANGDLSNGTYRFYDRDNSDWYLYYNNNNNSKKFTVRTNNNTYVRLYKRVPTSNGEEVVFTITPDSVNLAPGGELKLDGTVTVAGNVVDLNNCTIAWASDKTGVATVSNGTVTGEADGTANITATLSKVDGTNLQENIVLTIPVTVKSHVITFSTEEENTSEKEASLSLVVGENQTLTPYVTIDGQPVSLDDCEIEWSTGKNGVASCDGGFVNAIAASDEVVPITATLTKVNGYTLPDPMIVTYNVTVVEKAIRNAYLSTLEGYVIKNSPTGTVVEDANGSKVYVIIEYEDGTAGTAALTLDMIDLDGVNMTVAGVHNDRLVTYKGFEIPDFQLNVLGNPGNNFPKYPEPGSVRVNKVIGDGSQFQDTGVTEIQLSTSGLPMKAGLDVVLTIDISNSMAWKTGSSDKQYVDDNKLDELMGSVIDFAEILLAPNEDGSATDNTITIVTFAGYDAEHWNSSSGSYVDSVRTLVTATSSLEVITEIANKTMFTKADTIQIAYIPENLDQNDVDNVRTDAGSNRGDTNYDYGFWQTEQAIIAGNLGQDGREIHVVLMSDGCPSNYNGLYYRTKDSTVYFKPGTRENYTAYNTSGGTAWTDIVFDSIQENHGNIYAISLYNRVVQEHNGGMYAVGFDMANGTFGSASNWDSDVDWAETFNKIMEQSVVDNDGDSLITVDDHLVPVTDATDESSLNDFYTSLANAFRQAATSAYYVDQLSDSFNLQLANSVTKFKDQLDANGNPIQQVITLNPSPQIQISTYDIYRKLDVGSHTFTPTADMVGYMYYGVQITNAMVGKEQTGTVTEAMIGERYGAPVVIETVTFSPDGTKAYSNLIGDGKQDILGADGVIDAKNFWYNTKIAPVEIVLDDKGNTAMLDSEAFRWNIGTISDKEFVLSYYVYLDGAVEGNVPAGSYKTNNYAELHYVNWLENHVTKETVSPQVAWKSAQVSVAFYLVDADGNPMTNISTEATGSFYDAIKLTTPVVFDTVNLNSTDTITITQADLDHLLHGYTLYDPASVYQILIDSDNESSQWTTAKGAGKVDSVYVTNFYGAYASNIPDSKGLPWSSGVDYSNTVAWFAVKYDASTVPDVVVIDYGLPVDIDVLHNDMLNETAELVGVGQYNNGMSFADSHGTKTLGMTYAQKNTDNPNGANYGTAQVYGNKVRYTLGTMSMNSYEHFAYEVHQEVSGADQYYYGSVKVIPATTVYYEDSFVDLSVGEWRGTGWGPQDGNGDAQFQWTKVANSNRTQAEDRPGQHSLPEIDADNLYGYDGAYSDVAKYSMNGYAKVNVDYDHIAYAEFDFYGTGYDVISLTSSATGTIIVDTYEYQTSGDYSNVTPVKSFAVDTYYGYTREFYEVTYTYDAASGTWEPKEETKVDTLGTSDKKPETPADGATYSVYETRWIPSPNSDTIYQVPVMKVENLPYGRYHAKIQVFYDPFFDHVTESKDYDFYLDAIRIYDPAGNVYANTDDTTIKDAYIADGEGWPMYFELRNHILSVDSFSKAAVELLGQDNRMTGAVFIDGNEAVGDAQIADYKNFGPNNELYLAAGQDVAFILNLDKYCTFDATGEETGTIVASVQLGIKSATGEEVNYTICNINERGEYYAAEAYTLKTSTDMYYNITDYRGDVIVISNTDAEEILSITNIKVTFTQNPTEFNSNSPSDEGGNVTRSVQTFSLSASSDGQINAIDEDGQEEVGLIYMTYNATQRTLKALNERSLPDDSEEPEDVPTEPTVPEPTEPEATEPEATEPEATEPTEPEETKPKPPKPTEPKPKDPKPTEPKPTKPNKPTVPEEIKPKPNTKPKDTKPKPSKPEKKPAVTTPAEPEAFEPRFLNLFVSDSSVKVGEKVVVTVVTSAEVESLTVNGHEVKRYVESGWLVKTRTWIVTLKASQAGEMQIDVVAYDQESVASGTERATVEVREKKPGAAGKTPGKKHN